MRRKDHFNEMQAENLFGFLTLFLPPDPTEEDWRRLDDLMHDKSGPLSPELEGAVPALEERLMRTIRIIANEEPPNVLPFPGSITADYD